MKYYIFPDSTSANGLDLIFDPIDTVACNFFRSLKLELFPFYISELVERRNFGTENASFVFYHQMDFEDKDEFHQYFGREIKINEIRIRVYDGNVRFSVLDENEFLQIFSAYSGKLIELNQSENILPETWKNEMITLQKSLVEKARKADSIE